MPLDEVSKATDRKIEMRPDFEGALAPVEKLKRLFHVSKGFDALALQYVRYVFAHTHPHRVRTK